MSFQRIHQEKQFFIFGNCYETQRKREEGGGYSSHCVLLASEIHNLISYTSLSTSTDVRHHVLFFSLMKLRADQMVLSRIDPTVRIPAIAEHRDRIKELKDLL